MITCSSVNMERNPQTGNSMFTMLELDRGTAVGVALACLAATMNATGLNLQRLGQKKSSSAVNLLGVVLAASCGVVDMISFSFAPQSVLAPFGSLSLIINLLLAAPMHGDRVSRSDLLSTALVISGVATCLANANTASVSRSYEQLAGLAGRQAARAWALVLGTLIGLAATRLRNAGDGPASAGRFLYPLLAGGLGSVTALSGKAVGELLKAGAPMHVVAAVGALLGCTAVSQTVLLNKGVGKFSSLLVVPIFVAAFVTGNAVGGGLVFDEFSGMTEQQMRSYPVGLALLVGGVLILAGKKEKAA